MHHVSEAVRAVLADCGMHDRTVGAGKVVGMDAGMLEGTAHPLADAAAGGPRIRSGMGKAGAAKAPASKQEVGRRQVKLGRSGDSFLWLIADNVDVVPTGKRAMPAPFPVCIKGGKL